MSYSGGMSQLAHDQEEQQNESGLSDMEAYYHELDKIRLDTEPVQPDSCKPTSRIDEQQL